jgi:hypothetical protein
MNQPEPDKERPESKEKPFNELPVETQTAGQTPTPETPTPPKKIESKFQHFLRMALRWVIGFLIVFLLGALTMEFAFYRPLAGQLDQVKGERDQAQQTVKTLQGQLDSLAPLSNQNKTLQDQLSKSELHVTILSAEANVSSAQLSLMNNKPADARLVLDKTSTTLKTLQGMLPPDQQKVITDMQSRLNLALGELDNNKFAAQSDLNVLATSLVQLENTLFANP